MLPDEQLAARRPVSPLCSFAVCRRHSASIFPQREKHAGEAGAAGLDFHTITVALALLAVLTMLAALATLVLLATLATLAALATLAVLPALLMLAALVMLVALTPLALLAALVGLTPLAVLAALVARPPYFAIFSVVSTQICGLCAGDRGHGDGWWLHRVPPQAVLILRLMAAAHAACPLKLRKS